jgi:hypothetical protein
MRARSHDDGDSSGVSTEPRRACALLSSLGPDLIERRRGVEAAASSPFTAATGVCEARRPLVGVPEAAESSDRGEAESRGTLRLLRDWR